MTRVNIPMDDPSSYEKEFMPLEPGTYEMRIRNRLGLVTAQSGNKICKVELELMDDDGNKHVVFDNLTAIDSCHFKWYQFYRACGFTDEDIREGIELEDLTDIYVRVRLGQELDNNKKMKNIVKRYLYEDDQQEDGKQEESPEA